MGRLCENHRMYRVKMSKRYEILSDESWLKEHYIDKNMNCKELAILVGCSDCAIKTNLRKFGLVKPRGHKRNGNIFNITKEFLYAEYVMNNRTAVSISEEIGCAENTLKYWLDKFEIKTTFAVGEKNSQWTGGKPKCQNCGHLLQNIYAKRCHSCFTAFNRGKNHPNYLSPELRKTDESKIWRRRIEYKEWRKSVYEKYDYTCQKCKIRGGTLHPHHIENFSSCIEKRFDVENGIVFCVSCHSIFHSNYGQKYNNLEQVKEYIGEQI